MQFSKDWLYTMVDPKMATDALSHLLTMCGLEVEEVTAVAQPFSHVVVAQVLAVEPHPNADRLRVCQVDVGSGQTLTIVCGAANVRNGLKVPCAMVGAVLPSIDGAKSLEIKVGSLRGVTSEGMLCSARELGVVDDKDGLLELSDDAIVGQNFRDYYHLDDEIFTIKLTPNRADCLSVLGVAREVSALTGAALSVPACTNVPATIADVLPVTITAPDLCGRFSGRIIRGINAKAKTPQWMRERLERSGQRPITALVDISNYVMLELGQPTHIFDLDKVSGGLIVRWGHAGESITLLNGNTVTVDNSVGVIADEVGALAMAGIMGGESSSVSLDTQNIYVEVAFWQANAIAGRARRYNFSSEASHRFERGVDFSKTTECIARITALILEICGGTLTQFGPVDDQIINLPARSPVRLRSSRAVKIIGVVISNDQIADIFTRLQLPFVKEDADGDTVWVVTPPSYRFDIAIEEDLIEEIVRVYGFENIPASPPIAPSIMKLAPENHRSLFTVRHQLADLDYQEVINFSFVDAAWERDFAGNNAPIQVKNPISSQLGAMRSSLIGSLIANVQYNVNRKIPRVRIFEIGAVYLRDQSVHDGDLTVAGFDQPKRVSGVAYGPAYPEQWAQETKQVDYFDVKADIEALLAPLVLRFVKTSHPALHPGRAAQIEFNGKVVGYLGELHPRLRQQYDLPLAPIVFEIDSEILQYRGVPQFVEVPKFPEVTRDIALIVKNTVTAAELMDVFLSCASKNEYTLLKEVVLFDEYRGKGIDNIEKSLAFRFTLQDTLSTLQDDKVDAVMATFVAAACQYCAARLRA